MPNANRAVLCGILGLLVAGTAIAGQEPGGAPTDELDRLVPRWEAGDAWTVETVSRPLHIRADASQVAAGSPLRWQFRVAQPKEPGLDDCFRVEVKSAGAGAAIPATIFWLDRNSFALRQITTQLPVPDGFEEMTIRYDSDSGQPSPILGPLSALPIDTPVLYRGTKGLQSFSYTSHFGYRQGKELGDVGFSHQVEQQVADLPQDEVARLLGRHF
ncbi:MAG: hypothetical protein ACYC6Y_14150, partial [Thermoguttaceae bacterium]